MKGKTIFIGMLLVGFVLASVLGVLHFVEFGKVEPANGEVSLPQDTSTPQLYREEKEWNLTLYFSESTASRLVPEQRNVKVINEKELPKLAIEELLKGPTLPSAIAAVHQETKLHSVKVENGTAIVDFGDNFEKLNTGGSTRERLCLYAIVNTLTDLDGIEQVKLSVGGKVLDFFGQLELSEPLVRNADIVIDEK